jgi:nucleoside-diphosphate-sugar epimerase
LPIYNYFFPTNFGYGPNIKKFIYTSSISAAANVNPLSENPFLTEESWNPISDDPEKLEKSWMDAYAASKTWAERAIWKFKETAKPQFSISTFLLPLVYGPPIHNVTYENLGLSLSDVKQLIELPKDTKAIPVIAHISIDVRDVARGHVQSLSNPEFDNKRSVMIANVADGQLIADIIHKNRPTEAANLAIGTPGVYNTIPEIEYDFSKTNARLGFKFIPLQKTVLDQFDAIWQLKKESKKN